MRVRISVANTTIWTRLFSAVSDVESNHWIRFTSWWIWPCQILTIWLWLVVTMCLAVGLIGRLLVENPCRSKVWRWLREYHFRSMYPLMRLVNYPLRKVRCCKRPSGHWTVWTDFADVRSTWKSTTSSTKQTSVDLCEPICFCECIWSGMVCCKQFD